MKKVLKIGAIIFIVSIFIFTLMKLNNQLETSKELEKKIKEEKTTQLNVALINEDTGLVFKDKTYNLGLNYIKKIEKDTQHHWNVVSRGIAESGLKNGNYELMVVIPSNFSEQLLKLEDRSPERINITYKTNSNGNQAIENEANKMGNKIVQDLNQQLVDMYVASVLDNLYTAQLNIRTVMDNYENQIGSYANGVYQPAVNFQNEFTTLLTQSGQAKTSNDSLTDFLNNQTTGISSFIDSEKNFDENLASLLEQRAQGKLTYEEFIAALLDMNQDLLSDQTKLTYANLQATNQALQNQFSDGASEESLRKKMETLETNIQKEQEFLQDQLSGIVTTMKQIEEGTKAKVYELFDKEYDPEDEEKSLTLKELLTRYDPKKLKEIEGISDDDQLKLDDLKKQMESIYANLSFKELTPENLNLLSGLSQSEKKVMKANNQKIKELMKELQLDEADEAKEVKGIYEDSLKNCLDELANQGYEDRHLLINDIKMSSGKLTFNHIPDFIIIKQILVNGSTILTDNEVPIDDTVKTIDIIYTLKSNGARIGPNTKDQLNLHLTATSQIEIEKLKKNPPKLQANVKTDGEQPETGEEGASGNGNEGENENGGESEGEGENGNGNEGESQIVTVTAGMKYNTPVKASDFFNERSRELKNEYNQLIGKTFEQYQQTVSHLENYKKVFDLKGNTNDFLSMNMLNYFLQLVKETVFSQIEDIQLETKIRGLIEKGQMIQNDFGHNMQLMSEVIATTSVLQTNVDEQLAKLNQWQSNSSDLSNQTSGLTSINDMTDSQISSNKETVLSLIQTSESIKETSQAGVENSKMIHDVFNNFDQDVQQIDSKGKNLASDSEKLMGEFNTELLKNKDFVQAFTKVFKNSHNTGVVNDALLQFLAKPVESSAQQSIEATEVYKPFSWILIMYSTSLFVAYICAQVPIRRKIQDAFKKRALWITDNILITSILVVSGIVLGLIFSKMTTNSLGISIEKRLLWYTLVTGLTLVFVLLNHLLISQLSVLGVGITLYFLISYIFLTNAVGSSAVLSDFAKNVKNINPLTKGENMMIGFFSQTSLSTYTYVFIVLLVVALIILNLLIWHQSKKEEVIVK